MAKKIKTHAALAQRLGVSTKTIAAWRDNFRDWPPRRADGAFDLREVLAFCRRRRVGPSNPRRAGDSSKQSELESARIRKLLEKTANLRIENERQRAKQAKELEGIVGADDVAKLFRATVETVNEAHDKFIAELERLMPAEPPSTPEAWEAQRQAVIALTAALPRSVADAMKERLGDG